MGLMVRLLCCVMEESGTYSVSGVLLGYFWGGILIMEVV